MDMWYFIQNVHNISFRGIAKGEGGVAPITAHGAIAHGGWLWGQLCLPGPLPALPGRGAPEGPASEKGGVAFLPPSKPRRLQLAKSSEQMTTMASGSGPNLRRFYDGRREITPNRVGTRL